MSLVLMALVALQADTVRLDASSWLQQIEQSAPGVQAARLRSDAASQRAAQARAWRNPSLSFQVDNVGAEREVTNIDGWRGVEGQLVMTVPLPVGGDRGAAIRQGDASARVAEANAEMMRGDAIVRAVAAVANARRDTELLQQARSELATLERLAGALDAQADAGRASLGDAGRARLAVSVARERVAALAGAQRASLEELALMGGYAPGTAVVVGGPVCRVAESEAPSTSAVPEQALAEARTETARASLDLARATRIPDLNPEVGLRRTMGIEALYAGLSFDLPLFDRQSRQVDAARAELRAAELEGQDLVRQLEAQRSAAQASLAALTEAGVHFTVPDWADDLNQAVRAAEARWELGEGTLFELLDGRRARIDAISARERWAAQWLIAQARLLRLSGAPASADFFCEPFARLDS